MITTQPLLRAPRLTIFSQQISVWWFGTAANQSIVSPTTMSDNKRKGDEPESDIVLKKARTDMIVPSSSSTDIVNAEPQRTSGLLAPNMLLSGHEGAVHGVKFDPSGEYLASCSFDKTIFLWDVYGECQNFMVFRGHKNAVLDIDWSFDGSCVFSVSADKTASSWDVKAGRRVRKLAGHNGIVNCVAASRGSATTMVTGADDATVKIWDTRARGYVQSMDGRYQVTSVSYGADLDTVVSGGIDGIIRVWDLRKGCERLELEGHGDTITGLALSPDGTQLLSNGMDATLRSWDLRPFASGSRQLLTFTGAQHGFQKNLLRCAWSPDGSRVTGGSSDRMTHVWSASNGQPLYLLPGHKGSVNEVSFHPKEPILASCSADKTIFLGEVAAP